MRALAILLLSTSAYAAPVTGKAKIELGLRKPSYFLGDNVLVDFCVVNVGTAPLSIGVGGDYRGSTRALRFKIDVKDARGASVPDPDPNPFNMGGLGYSPTIEPGKKWCESLPLLRYARITQPGTYTITATHDLEWPKGQAPTGTAKITFAMPTAAQAEQVIAAMEKLPEDPNRSAGQVSIDYQDFSTLAFDVYAPLLAKRAAAGNVKAIAGLSFNPTIRATRELVTLMKHTDRKVARAATRGLAMRLPDPQLTGQLGSRNPFHDNMTDLRKYLSAGWDPQLADDIRAIARARLGSSEIEDQIDGAFILEAVGLPGDAVDLAKALTAAIERTRTVAAETDVYPVPRGSLMELQRATEMLLARGLAPAASPTTLGDLAILLIAIKTGQRPATWQTELAKALAHAVPYVRELALASTPDPVPAQLIPAIAANLGNADVDVQVAAAELARRGKLTQLGPDVVKAMKRATGIRLSILSSAADELGARLARIDMLIARLSDKAAFDEALSELCDLLSYSGRSSDGEPTDAQRAAVVPHWKALVAAHQTEILAGTKLPLASVSPKLVPPQWKLGRPTGGQWP